MMKISNVVTFVAYLALFLLVIMGNAYTTFKGGLVDGGMDQVTAGDFAAIATVVVFIMGLITIYVLPKYFTKVSD